MIIFISAVGRRFLNVETLDSVKCVFGMLTLISRVSIFGSWFSGLESSKWMTHLSALLRSAVGIVRTIASEGRPVVIHCSDGWDRTPQLVALAELMMDPYYRRLDGFQVLIEREWLAFGHKFGDRCGQGCGPNSNAHNQNERCPIFSQWLDCVYQLMRQFPTAFQFNSNYLVRVQDVKCIVANRP
jgi:myotubularin-related protein 3/4